MLISGVLWALYEVLLKSGSLTQTQPILSSSLAVEAPPIYYFVGRFSWGLLRLATMSGQCLASVTGGAG